MNSDIDIDLLYTGFAISGKAGSGKTTLSLELCKFLHDLNISPVRVSFADYLKEITLIRRGKRKSDKGGREALMEIGAEMRWENPMVFVDELERRVRAHWLNGLLPIIDDVRYPNELDWVITHNFLTIRIEAPPHVRRARLKKIGEDVSVVGSGTLTENALDGHRGRFHLVVENDSAYLPSDLQVAAGRAIGRLMDSDRDSNRVQPAPL